jgi:hypothetical protein
MWTAASATGRAAPAAQAKVMLGRMEDAPKDKAPKDDTQKTAR